MNIPNLLTSIRLVLVPVFLFIFFSDISNRILIAFLVFLAAGLTDVLDGFIARRFNMVTKWGSVLDPLADKLMSLTVLISLTVSNMIPTWILLIIGVKELLMIAGGARLFKTGNFVPSKFYGKISTVLFYISIITLEFVNRSLGLIFIYATVLSALFALYKYIEQYVSIQKSSSN
jgi:cardiolipin synthase (CMP-forming)